MEKNKSFYPNQIQVKLLDIADRNNIRVQVYERETMPGAMGSSCSKAAITTAFELGLVDRKVTIHTSNGPLEVEINTDGSVQMAGAAREASSVVVSRKVLEYLNHTN